MLFFFSTRTRVKGPGVGFILRRTELALPGLHPVPLDYCGADTQGAIGYMFQQAPYDGFQKRLRTSGLTTIWQTSSGWTA